jgi:hypothetical protein
MNDDDDEDDADVGAIEALRQEEFDENIEHFHAVG